ncbi:MAG: hypothetical protein LM593_05090 [Candidatus Verstraetearchaeota archaeon]|nr:hypothetical protein [Candidatus Verstraetearchaeota archaeon]
MKKIDIIIVPNLRSSYEKLSEFILNSNYDVIFLNFPRFLNSLIRDFSLNKITYDELINKISKIIPEYINSWLYINEPIIKILNKVNSEVYCYLEEFDKIMENSIKIATLTLRSRITNKINIKEWLEVLKESGTDIESIVEFINIKSYGKSLCVVGLSPWKLAKRLRELGFDVKIKSIERIYYLKPLEILSILLEKGKFNEKLAEELIKEHIRFIYDFVITHENIDKAYFSWISQIGKFLII